MTKNNLPTKNNLRLAAVAAALLATGPARAADKFYAYNLTTSTNFPGVYLAPAGTDKWGTNEALGDDDKSLQVTERIGLGIRHGIYDVKLVDEAGHTCIKRRVDLTKDKTFDVRDTDLAACQ